jgi:chitinase
MQRCFLVFSLFLVQVILAQPYVVGYYNVYPVASPWTYKDIPYNRMTHIDLAFYVPDANGNIPVNTSANIDSLVARAHAAGVKVLPSLGGGGSSGTLPGIAGSAAKRATLAHSARLLFATDNFDGVDIDWEFPGQADTANLRLMVTALRDTFNAIGNGKLITLAVNCSDIYGKYYRVERFIDKYDFLGIMTYDITGSWEATTWYNSPLYGDGYGTNWSIKQGMDYWVGRGIPKAKLLTGTPFYGRTFANATGKNQPNKGTGTGTGGYLIYSSIVPLLNSGFYKYHWDTLSQVPWGLSSTNEFITYDDPRSVAVKGRWLVSNGYAGTDIWEISGDLHSGTSYALMDSLYLSMHPPTLVRKSVNGYATGRNLQAMASAGQSGRVRIFDMSGRLIPARDYNKLFLSRLSAGKVLLVETRAADGCISMMRIAR